MVSQWIEALVAIIGFVPAVSLFIVGGVFGLKYGADWLVDGSANLGFRFGVSTVMIGLTIVAFGTSAPELVVSVLTAAQEKSAICLGNVIGSNIANTSLVLGATATIYPLHVNTSSAKIDGGFSFAAILLLGVLAYVGTQISRVDGLILLVVFSTWLFWQIRHTLANRKKGIEEQVDGEEETHFHPRKPMIDLLLIGIGLVCLVIGADMLVAGAVKTAQALEVPDIVVGLTIVAGGTSLPELAVSMMAAIKKHADITIGNVMGSNIFNALLILGVACVIFPIAFDVEGFGWTGDAGTLYFDIPFCIALCGLIIPLMLYNARIGRLKGILLLATYAAYIGSLVIRNS